MATYLGCGAQFPRLFIRSPITLLNSAYEALVYQAVPNTHATPERTTSWGVGDLEQARTLRRVLHFVEVVRSRDDPPAWEMFRELVHGTKPWPLQRTGPDQLEEGFDRLATENLTGERND